MEDYRAVRVGGHQRNSQRFAALVDETDVEAVSGYYWSIDNNGYAYRKTRVDGKTRLVYMHRDLLGLVPGDGLQADHINGDKLDNRRANLRVCTNAQNGQNLHNRPYRGTSWDAPTNRWRARAKLNGKQHHLGLFVTREEAAAVAATFRREHMPYSADARHRASESLSGIEEFIN
jgi:hypothetical protein